MTAATLRPLSCRGCGRSIGTTTASRSLPVWCEDPFCGVLPPAGVNEDRDSLVTLLLAQDVTQVEIAELFGITRQRIAQLQEG